MSELNNAKYLDFGGLKTYDILIKEYIQSADQSLSDELTALINASDEKIDNLIDDYSGTLSDVDDRLNALESIGEITEDQINSLFLDGSDSELDE